MTKKKVPNVADLIDDAIIMIAQAMSGKAISLKANELSIYLNMLVTIDKNERDSQLNIGKLTGVMTEEQLEATIAAHIDAVKEPE